jgi:hypothetical protein
MAQVRYLDRFVSAAKLSRSVGMPEATIVIWSRAAWACHFIDIEEAASVGGLFVIRFKVREHVILFGNVGPEILIEMPHERLPVRRYTHQGGHYHHMFSRCGLPISPLKKTMMMGFAPSLHYRIQPLQFSQNARWQMLIDKLLGEFACITRTLRSFLAVVDRTEFPVPQPKHLSW